MNLELFPCSGGMAEGFRRADLTFDLAFDKDVDACNSYEANLGHRPVQLDVRDLLRMVEAGWSPGPVRLLVADPPCTPWSRAGKRLGVEDERDMLGTTCELIRLLKPDAYLIGNVPGLDDATQWHHVQDALAPLRKAGYCIADYTSLDAADYGVPQHRVRPFWFGHLDGPCIQWPLPTHADPSHPALPGLELLPWVTCRQALQHLPLEELGRPVRLKRAAETDGGHPASEPDQPSRTLHAEGGRAGNDRHPPAQPAQTLGAKDRGQSTVLLANHEWPWNRPATTVLTDPRIPPPGHHEGSFLSPPESRGSKAKDWPWDAPSTVVFAGTAQTGGPGKGSPGNRPNAVVLSERAATILQGFPEGWLFSGATKKARWGQLGQAMPPTLAHAVATSVRAQLESGWARRPRRHTTSQHPRNTHRRAPAVGRSPDAAALPANHE